MKKSQKPEPGRIREIKITIEYDETDPALFFIQIDKPCKLCDAQLIAYIETLCDSTRRACRNKAIAKQIDQEYCRATPGKFDFVFVTK